MQDVRRNEDEGQAMTEQGRLGQRLRAAREYLGLSQELVAERLGIPRASVSAFESGKRRVTGLELKQLAQMYRTPVAQILGEDSAEADVVPDATFRALFRTAHDLSSKDREQVLRFAEFLREAGRAPISEEGRG